jgi:hypothetical protein
MKSIGTLVFSAFAFLTLGSQAFAGINISCTSHNPNFIAVVQSLHANAFVRFSRGLRAGFVF